MRAMAIVANMFTTGPSVIAALIVVALLGCAGVAGAVMRRQDTHRDKDAR